MRDVLKQMMIHTPLERPLQQLRYLASFRKRRRHPELAELFAESGRIELFLAKLLRRDSNCLDVGCHLGSFLSLLLRLAPDGKHMAFEALPEKAVRLRGKFREAQVVQSAICDKAGEITFYQDLTYSGYSGMTVQRKEHKVQELRVRCDTLDNLVPPDRPIHFIKVDVEGAEALVLRGATRLINRWRPTILFECTPEGANGQAAPPPPLRNNLQRPHAAAGLPRVPDQGLQRQRRAADARAIPQVNAISRPRAQITSPLPSTATRWGRSGRDAQAGAVHLFACSNFSSASGRRM